MNLQGSIYLGLRYLQRHRGKAALLIFAISISLFLPLAILMVVRQAETHLRARADSTPLLLGAPGSQLELVFNGLYYSKPEIRQLEMGQTKAATSDGLCRAIPLYVQFQARGFRIVGTSIDYFRFRRLEVAQGHLFARLGQCVVGSEVAEELGLKIGDPLVSKAEQMFDIAGVYPLKMQVAGILQPSGSPDDRAVFADLQTTWVIAGIGHGHQEAVAGDKTVLETDGQNLALNASVVEYTEITPENIASFHFHGDPDTFPLTAAIVLPKDRKSETLLLGRYQADDAPAQLVRPAEVMDDLFATVFQVRDIVVASLFAVGVASALISALVFVLSNRLRAREFESLANIGAAPGSVRLLIAFEAVFVILASLVLVAILLGILRWILPALLQQLT